MQLILRKKEEKERKKRFVLFVNTLVWELIQKFSLIQIIIHILNIHILHFGALKCVKVSWSYSSNFRNNLSTHHNSKLF